jgi:hypothetical protein
VVREAELNRHADACGCEGGAFGLLVVGCAYAVLRFALGIRMPGGAAVEGAVWTAVAVAAAAVGKVLARRRSRRVLLRLQHEVERARTARVLVLTS